MCRSVTLELCERMGVGLDDKRLRLVVAVWSAILLATPGDLGPETDWDQVDIDILLSFLDDTYKQFIDICTSGNDG